MISSGWQTWYSVLLLCMSSSRCRSCPVRTRTPYWRWTEWRSLALVQTYACVAASRSKVVWKLKVPKGYQSYSDDSIGYVFTLQESKLVYQNVLLSLRNAEILYTKSCDYELLRIFSSLCWIPFVQYLLCASSGLQICRNNWSFQFLGVAKKSWPEPI